MNNKFREHCAERFADRLIREAPGGPAARVRRAYELAFARRATDAEVAFGQDFAAKHGLSQLCLVLLNTNEFVYLE